MKTLADITLEDVEAFLADNASVYNASSITSYLEAKAATEEEKMTLATSNVKELIDILYEKSDNTFKTAANAALKHDSINGFLTTLLGGMTMDSTANNTNANSGAGNIDGSSSIANNGGSTTIVDPGTTTGTSATHKTTRDRAAANFKALPKEVQDQVLAKVSDLSDTLAQMSAEGQLTGYIVNSGIRNTLISSEGSDSSEPVGISIVPDAKKVEAFLKKYPAEGLEQNPANIKDYEALVEALKTGASSGEATIQVYVPAVSGQKLAGVEVSGGTVIPMKNLASQVFINYAGFLTSNINAQAGIKVDGYKPIKKSKAEISSQAPDKNELAIKLLGKTTAMKENPECVKYASTNSPDGKTHPYTVRSAMSFKYHCKVKKNGKEEDRVKTIRFSQAVDLPEQVRSEEYADYAGDFPAIYGKGLTSTPEQFTGTKEQIQQVAENLAAMAKTGDAAMLESNELLKDIFALIKGSEEASDIDPEGALE